MNKVAHYLQEHLLGEVIGTSDARQFFSTDGSIFSVIPTIIVYPQGENDVRKTARFTWQMAERGRAIPMTARGAGTDQSGAAIGSGIILVFPAHMNRILEFDTKSGQVTVEPGLNYGKLQQALHTHERFLPPYPSSLEYSTIGGAISNNASGEKSFKYGDTRKYVKSLRVVLANGEIIETKRISKRELSKKLGLATFEGEIYRNLDTLLEENKKAIASQLLTIPKNSAGYALGQIKKKDGSFDLTPLFVGSQGTLGIITEAVLDTEVYAKTTTLICAYFDSLQIVEETISEIRKLADLPCTVEAVDNNLLNYVHKTSPNLLKGLIKPPFPKMVMFIEFDSSNERQQKRNSKRLARILSKQQVPMKIEQDPAKQELIWKLRHSSAMVLASAESAARAIPLIEDGIVPVERFKDYVSAIYDMFERLDLDIALWGHAGEGSLSMAPLLDLGHVGDRQKLFRLLDEYNNLVIGLGGSISARHGDGRLRGPYLSRQVGEKHYQLLEKVKTIFDPYGTLNPGVKVGVTLDSIKPLVRHEFGYRNLYQHLPRS